MVKLNKNKEKNVTLMQDLKDGQLAIVLLNYTFPNYEGTIIQRFKDSAVAIGRPSGYCWDNIENCTLKVRILKEGEILTIFDNK